MYCAVIQVEAVQQHRSECFLWDDGTIFIWVIILNLTVLLFDNFSIGWGFVLLENLPDLTNVQYEY